MFKLKCILAYNVILYLCSLLKEMMKNAQELNITYHPFLDNFYEFDDVPRTEFNESLKFVLASALATSK